MEIKDKVFLVTGAGSGLGAATARNLIDGGAKVVLADVNREAGESLAAELGANARFVETDVTSEASAVNAINTANSAFGGLHGLVNCAGVGPAEKVVGREGPHRLESFVRTININLVGTFNMIRLAAEAMMKGVPDDGGERGVIVNTASVAAFKSAVFPLLGCTGTLVAGWYSDKRLRGFVPAAARGWAARLTRHPRPLPELP